MNFIEGYKILVINIGELTLKGSNQKLFSDKLKNHIKTVLKVMHEASTTVQLIDKRITVESEKEFSYETLSHLAKIPGISSVNLGKKGPLDFEEFLKAVKEEVETYQGEDCPKTFKINTKRSNKKFPMSSYDISCEVGSYVLENFPHLKVDVKKPELKINVKVMSHGIYLYSRSFKGLDGLPVGMSGHMVTMLSGGFDSPVASYLMAKRGVEQTFVFFHAYPFVGDEVKEKILKITSVLTKYQRKCQLYVVPFGELQKIIAEKCRPAYRTLLFRKFMVDCSNLIAKKIKAQGIITGDAIGQVSSQTIQNLSLIDKASELPIFRPLVGLNKLEIISLAQKAETHDISVIPQDDACSLLAPKHPVTNPHKGYWYHFLQENDFSKELSDCVEKAEIYHPTWKGEFFKNQ